MSLDEFDFLRRYSRSIILSIDSNVISAMVCVSILSESFLFRFEHAQEGQTIIVRRL